jgi:hypothetical protein
MPIGLMLTCIVDNLVGTKERAMATDKRKVLRRIESGYLLDYAIFTGAVRVYVRVAWRSTSPSTRTTFIGECSCLRSIARSTARMRTSALCSTRC